MINESTQASRLATALSKWKERGLYRNLATPDRRTGISGLPIITKTDLRSAFPDQLLPAEHSLEKLLAEGLVEVEYTSGTSAERLPVVFGRNWWNEQEERALRLNRTVAAVLNEHPNVRRATITTPACNGLTCPTVWSSVPQRTFGNTLFVNLARIPFVLTDDELQRMANEIAVWKPQFLDLDPVHGAWFALFCERKGIRFPSLRFILCSYEFVSVVHRRILQRVFGVPVFNLYGSTETGHLLMEAEAGQMNPSHDTAYLELTELDEARIGTLLVTTLSNDYMPLLRYRIGDLAERIETPYGTDYIIHGRIRDALKDSDGRRVTTWQVDQCFRDIEGIAHYQLRPGEQGDYRLRYIPDLGAPTHPALPEFGEELANLLKSRVTIEAAPTLLPEASGKFRLTAH